MYLFNWNLLDSETVTAIEWGFGSNLCGPMGLSRGVLPEFVREGWWSDEPKLPLPECWLLLPTIVSDELDAAGELRQDRYMCLR